MEKEKNFKYMYKIFLLRNSEMSDLIMDTKKHDAAIY